MMKWATKHRDDSAHFSVQILFFTFLIGIAVVTPISFVFPGHKNGKKKKWPIYEWKGFLSFLLTGPCMKNEMHLYLLVLG